MPSVLLRRPAGAVPILAKRGKARMAQKAVKRPASAALKKPAVAYTRSPSAVHLSNHQLKSRYFDVDFKVLLTGSDFKVTKLLVKSGIINNWSKKSCPYCVEGVLTDLREAKNGTACSANWSPQVLLHG